MTTSETVPLYIPTKGVHRIPLNLRTAWPKLYAHLLDMAPADTAGKPIDSHIVMRKQLFDPQGISILEYLVLMVVCIEAFLRDTQLQPVDRQEFERLKNMCSVAVGVEENKMSPTEVTNILQESKQLVFLTAWNERVDGHAVCVEARYYDDTKIAIYVYNTGSQSQLHKPLPDGKVVAYSFYLTMQEFAAMISDMQKPRAGLRTGLKRVYRKPHDSTLERAAFRFCYLQSVGNCVHRCFWAFVDFLRRRYADAHRVGRHETMFTPLKELITQFAGRMAELNTASFTPSERGPHNPAATAIAAIANPPDAAGGAEQAARLARAVLPSRFNASPHAVPPQYGLRPEQAVYPQWPGLQHALPAAQFGYYGNLMYPQQA